MGYFCKTLCFLFSILLNVGHELICYEYLFVDISLCIICGNFTTSIINLTQVLRELTKHWLVVNIKLLLLYFLFQLKFLQLINGVLCLCAQPELQFHNPPYLQLLFHLITKLKAQNWNVILWIYRREIQQGCTKQFLKAICMESLENDW